MSYLEALVDIHCTRITYATWFGQLHYGDIRQSKLVLIMCNTCGVGEGETVTSVDSVMSYLNETHSRHEDQVAYLITILLFHS